MITQTKNWISDANHQHAEAGSRGLLLWWVGGLLYVCAPGLWAPYLVFTDTPTAAVLIRINSAAKYNVKVIDASVKLCQTPRPPTKEKHSRGNEKQTILPGLLPLFVSRRVSFSPRQKKGKMHYQIAVIINFLGHCISMVALLIAFFLFLCLR